MEGRGIDDIQPVPCPPPGPSNTGTRQFVPPAPGKGRCELNTGGDISIGFTLNLVWSRSLQRTQGVPPESWRVPSLISEPRSYLHLTICH